MQMGPKEIAVEYRTAANKQKQIRILAQLNQCAERRSAEILDAEGEELPKKWQVQLLKPARRSRKFPEGEATPEEPEELAETPSVTASRKTGRASEAGNVARSPRVGISLIEGGKPATDRDLFEAVATLLPEAAPVGADSIRPEPEEPAEVPVAPRNEDEARHWVDDVGPVTKAAEAVPTAAPEKTATATLDTSAWKRAVELKIAQVGISDEELLREACRLMASALALSPDEYHTYSCGVLDLVHALTEE